MNLTFDKGEKLRTTHYKCSLYIIEYDACVEVEVNGTGSIVFTMEQTAKLVEHLAKFHKKWKTLEIL